jgi:lipopolysaccharide export system permease protein
MNKNNELIAFKSGGISVYHLLRSVLGVAFVFSFLLFFLSEVIVPITISKANHIWFSEVKKKSAVTSKQKDIWIKGQRAIYSIKFFNPQNLTISGITLNYFDKDFRLEKRVDASKGRFNQGKWVFYDTMEQVLDKTSGSYKVQFHSEQAEEVDFFPDDLKQIFKESDEMNIKELYTYINEVELEGYDATTYQVDFHARFALPAVCIIVCLMGTGIAVKRRTREGPSVTVAYGGGLMFLYWVLNSFSISLGYGGLLPPFISAWISNIIFFCYGVLNLIHAE